MNGIVILGCGASFRSGSPHIFSATLLHLTLIISLTCGSCPLTLQQEDRHQETWGLFFSDHGLNAREEAGIASLKLILPIRPVKHAHPKTNTTPIYQHPVGSAKALIVLTLLKVCHIFLIIFTRIHVRVAPMGMGMRTCGEEMCQMHFPGKTKVSLNELV